VIKAAFLTQHADWHWKRQLPNEGATFEGVRFFVDTDEADIVFVYDALPQNSLVLHRPTVTVFVASEPQNVKRYKGEFLAQFDAVITADRETAHPKRIFVQAGLPWHVGTMSAGGRLLSSPMLFEEFETYTPVKSKLVSVVSSDKAFTSEHRARLAFVQKLKAAFGDQVDVFGRGISDFSDKRDVLDAYRYHIALENCAIPDYWTEKLADPYLTLTFPIYHGCPNVSEYFPSEAFRAINIYEPDKAISIIREIIESDTAERQMVHMLDARNKILREHNVFALLSRVSRDLLSSNVLDYSRQKKVIYAEGHFASFKNKVLMRLHHSLSRYPLVLNFVRILKRKASNFTRHNSSKAE
jgi:hypothetical protein